MKVDYEGRGFILRLKWDYTLVTNYVVVIKLNKLDYLVDPLSDLLYYYNIQWLCHCYYHFN